MKIKDPTCKYCAERLPEGRQIGYCSQKCQDDFKRVQKWEVNPEWADIRDDQDKYSDGTRESPYTPEDYGTMSFSKFNLPD